MRHQFRMLSKEDIKLKYQACKGQLGLPPRYQKFLTFAEISKRQLESAYGRNAYAKLQSECGDEPNRFRVPATSRATIMKQYGDLALRLLPELPTSSDWRQSGLRPTVEGLSKAPHRIKWSEFPLSFSEWISSAGVTGYEKVVDQILKSAPKPNQPMPDREAKFEELLSTIRAWSPARRRSSEESYKVELRGHLGSLGYDVEEERGDSIADLFVDQKYVIEMKKDPSLSEYDRLFGQLARHLRHKRFAIALVFDVPREDAFRDFTQLVDAYFGGGHGRVEVMKK